MTPARDIATRDFKGEDTTSARGVLPDNIFRRLRGVQIDRPGKLRASLGPTTIFDNGDIVGGLETKNILRYDNGTTQRLIYTAMVFGGGGTTIVPGVRAWNEGNDTDDGIIISGTSVTKPTGYTDDELSDMRMVQEGDGLFVVSPGNKMYVWYGTGTGREAGVQAPANPPTLTFPGSADELGEGGPYTIGPEVPLHYYQYVYTYVTSKGYEGNPSDYAYVTSVDHQRVNVEIDWPVSLGDIVKARVYRLGGYVTNGHYLVGEITNPADDMDDSLADVNIGRTKVSYNHDVPPDAMDIIASHKNRLWAANSRTNVLYFSGLNRLESWSTAEAGLATDGGSLVLPGASGDGPLAFASTGNILMIGRKESVYALYGNNFNEFVFSWRSNVGIASKDAMCRAINEVYYFGRDRRLYVVTDTGAQRISVPIQADLDDLTAAQIASSKLVYHDARLFLCFGSGDAAPDDIAYVYHFEQGEWTEERGLIVRSIISARDPHATDAPYELLYVNEDGDAVLKAFDDALSERYVSIRTNEFEIAAQRERGRVISGVDWLHAEGRVENGANTLTNMKVKAVAEAGESNEYARTYSINATNGYLSAQSLLYSFQPQQDVTGLSISVYLEGYVTDFELTRMVTSIINIREDG